MNSIIAIAVRDEGSRYWIAAKHAIKAIGGTRNKLHYRSSYVLLGYNGNPKMGWITEVYNLRGKGPSKINKTIHLGNTNPTKNTSQAILLQGKHDKIMNNVRDQFILKAHCHPRISYGHTKLISQVRSKNFLYKC